MKKICITLLLYCSFLSNSLSQDPFVQNPVPPSPTAAGLGKYGDIPVSYHTGIPNISIPLYTITEGELSLPISLSYHSSGIKVNELASWVGLGWTLNAGGAIIRTVQSSPDDGLKVSKGWYQDETYGVTGKGGLTTLLESAACTESPLISQTCISEYERVENGEIDTEPDIFAFNINGYSGKFFFDEFRIAHIQPEQDIKIQPVYDINEKEFSSWELITPDGIKYIFGGAGATERALTSTGVIVTNVNDDLSSTTWYLARIENFNGTKYIEFIYEDEKYSYGNRLSHSVTFGGNCQITSGNVDNAPIILNHTMVLGKRLTHISTSSGLCSVEFSGDSLRRDLSGNSLSSNNTEAKRLDLIRILEGSSEREFLFDYTYFQSATSSSNNIYPTKSGADTLRLKLNSVQERGRSSSAINFEYKPKHSFEYEESQTMARRFSLGRDYWGYYNGSDNNTGLISKNMAFGPSGCANQFSSVTTNREPDALKMEAWILKKINYPTGGYTTFEYEPHKERPSSNTIYGGLRIKKITNYSDQSVVEMIKQFAYPDGRLYLPDPRNDDKAVIAKPNDNNEVADREGYPYLGTFVTSEINAPLSASLGYHFGYSIVEVSNISYQNSAVTTGKIRYTYFNPAYPTYAIYYYPSIPAELNLINSKLHYEEHLDDNNNVIKKVTNFYKIDLEYDIIARRVVYHTCQIDGCPINKYYLPRSYKINTGRSNLAFQEIYQDGAITLKSYDYSTRHNRPIKETIINSDGTNYITETDYNFDKLPNCSYPNANDCWAAYFLATNNLGISSSLAFKNCAYCDQNSNDYDEDQCEACRNSVRDDHFNSLSILQQNYDSCTQIVSQDYQNCISEALNSVNEQDKALALSIQNNWLFSTEQRSFTESLQTGGNRIHYATNQYDHLVPASFSLYETISNGGNWQLRDTAEFNTDAMLVERTPESGESTGFIWGYSQTRPTAQVLNATQNKIAYSSFDIKDVSTLENGGWQLSEQATILEDPIIAQVTPGGASTGIVIQSYTDTVKTTINLELSNNIPSGKNKTVNFERIGSWILETIDVTNTPTSIDLFPGSYNVYIDEEDSTYAAVFLDWNNKRSSFQGFNHSQKGKTGEHCYQILNSNTISRYNLTPGDYLLSYWKQEGGNIQASVSGGGSITSLQTYDADSMNWQLETKRVSISSFGTTVSVSSNDAYIDELRIHPIDAEMTTYSYDDRYLLKNVIDPNHIVTTYEYDALGRLVRIKDQDDNIIQQIGYNYRTTTP